MTPGAVLPQPGDEALQPDLGGGHAAEHGGAGAGRARRVADQAGHRATLQHEAPPVAGGILFKCADIRRRRNSVDTF